MNINELQLQLSCLHCSLCTPSTFGQSMETINLLGHLITRRTSLLTIGILPLRIEVIIQATNKD